MNPYLLIQNPTRPSSYLYKTFRLNGNWPETEPASNFSSPIAVKLAEEFPIGTKNIYSAVGVFNFLYGDEVLFQFEMEKWLKTNEAMVFTYRNNQYEGRPEDYDEPGSTTYVSGKARADAMKKDVVIVHREDHLFGQIPGDITVSMIIERQIRSAYRNWQPAPPRFASDARFAIKQVFDAPGDDRGAGESWIFKFKCPASKKSVLILFAFWKEAGGFIREPWTPIFVVAHSDPLRFEDEAYFMTTPEDAMEVAFELCSYQKAFRDAHPNFPAARSERRTTFIRKYQEAYNEELSKFKLQYEKDKEISQEIDEENKEEEKP